MKTGLIAVAGMGLAVVLCVGSAESVYADSDWAFALSFGFSSGWPIFSPVVPAPVVVAPRPVVVAPRPVVVAPRPVLVGAKPLGYFGGYKQGYKQGYRQGFRQGIR